MKMKGKHFFNKFFLIFLLMVSALNCLSYVCNKQSPVIE